MILLSSARQRVTNVPLLFRAHSVLGAETITALSYGRTIAAVMDRAEGMTFGVVDQRGRRGWASEDRGRIVHCYDGARFVPVLLLEGASTNLLHLSQKFTSGAWGTTNLTVTEDLPGPDGRPSAARLTASATGATVLAQTRVVAATAAAFSVDITRGSSATTPAAFGIRNETTATDLVFVTFDYGTGTVAYTTGASGVAVQRLGASGWYRLLMAARSGITSGDSIRGYVGFSGGVHTGGDNLIASNAQLEARGWPTSPIIVPSTTPQSRVTDTLYFPTALPLKPCTLYLRFVELGTGLDGANHGVCGLGSGDNASIFLLNGGANTYHAIHRQFSDVSTATVLPSPAFGDMVELRLEVFETGALRLSQALNGGAEVVGAASAAQAFLNAFYVGRFYVGSRGPLAGAIGVHAALVAEGYPSLTECRDLCEVG